MGGEKIVKNKHRFSESFTKYSLPILIVSFLITTVLAFQLYPLPSFNTEIAEFAPNDSASEAAEEFGIEMGNQTKQVLVNVEMKNSGNVLSIESLQRQQNDYYELLNILWCLQNVKICFVFPTVWSHQKNALFQIER